VKFFTRKFLFVPTVAVLGVAKALAPNFVGLIPRTVLSTVTNSVFGDGAGPVVLGLFDFLDGNGAAG